MGNAERDYRRLVRARLETLSARMVERLRGLFETPLHPDVAVVDVEVFADGTPPEARIFLMDRHNTEVFGDSEEFLTSSLELLPGVDSSQIDNERLYEFEEAGVDVFETNLDETITWLARCWERTGGGWPGIPAYVSPHDDVRSFDLREKRWTDDREDKERWFAN